MKTITMHKRMMLAAVAMAFVFQGLLCAESYRLKVLNANTPIRETPSSTGKVAYVVAEGTILKSDNVRNGWYRVQLPEPTASGLDMGYIYESKVDLLEARNDTPAPQTPARPAPQQSSPAPRTGSATDLKMNVFIDLGIAAGDLPGFLFTLGFQNSFTPELFGEYTIDFLSPSNASSSISVMILVTSGDLVYKFKLSPDVVMFIKGGLSYATLMASSGGVSISGNLGFGLNAGLGFEFAVSPNMAIRLGASLFTIFASDITATVFKFHGGLNYGF